MKRLGVGGSRCWRRERSMGIRLDELRGESSVSFPSRLSLEHFTDSLPLFLRISDSTTSHPRTKPRWNESLWREDKLEQLNPARLRLVQLPRILLPLNLPLPTPHPPLRPPLLASLQPPQTSQSPMLFPLPTTLSSDPLPLLLNPLDLQLFSALPPNPASIETQPISPPLSSWPSVKSSSIISGAGVRRGFFNDSTTPTDPCRAIRACVDTGWRR